MSEKDLEKSFKEPDEHRPALGDKETEGGSDSTTESSNNKHNGRVRLQKETGEPRDVSSETNRDDLEAQDVSFLPALSRVEKVHG